MIIPQKKMDEWCIETNSACYRRSSSCYYLAAGGMAVGGKACGTTFLMGFTVRKKANIAFSSSSL